MLISANAITLTRQGKALGIPLTFHTVSGDLIWVRGPNGSGKSTLLLSLAGLLKIHPAQSLRWAEPKPSVFYLGHQLGLVPEFTAFEHCYYHPSLSRPEPATINAVFETLGIAPWSARLCAQLSRGQAQRVAMAVGLLANASLWLLDEPFTGLDATSIAVLKAQIKQHTAQGAAWVVSHQDISDICTQTLSMGSDIDVYA